VLTAPGAGPRAKIERVDDLGRTRLARVRLGANRLVATVPNDLASLSDEAG